MQYRTYNAKYSNLTQEEYDALYPICELLLQNYAESYIAESKLKNNFDDYELELKEALIYQIYFISTSGGMDALNGKSDFNLKSVTTSGFNYQYNTDSDETSVEYFGGVPIAPISAFLIKNQLRKKGYLKRWIYA